MMGWLRPRNKIRYSRSQVIRVLPSGIVERKYVRNGTTTIWKQVDCFTLSPSEQPRLCLETYKTRLLKTAI